LGAIHLKKKDMCVHAESVLAFLKENHGLTFALDREKIEASYLVKTGSFIDVFGGLLVGEPTLFYGTHGSGKTLSSLTIIARYSRIQKDRIVYICTETGDPRNNFARDKVAAYGGNLDLVDFYAFVEESKLHSFLGGKSEGGEKGETLKDVMKKGDIGLVVVDSVTNFYNTQVDNVPPSQLRLKYSVASVFSGKLGVWVRYMQSLMFKQQKPFPIIFTAWLKSSAADALLKALGKESVGSINPHEKDWKGPTALGYRCKIRYRLDPIGVKKVKFTQLRGDEMMKSVVCNITERGVELAEGD
jgi:hypothetical protein